jgi:hypothetical protein
MKKLLLILVVLAVAAPCVAGTITFGAVDNNAGTCTLTYYTTGAGSVPPVAMGLLVEVAGGNPIIEVTDIDEFFEIYMDAAFDMEDPCDPCHPYEYGDGTPIADPCGPGQIALPQMRFVISMGGLGGATKPKTKFPKGGTKNNPATLCVLHTDTALAGGTTSGTISICPLRGGVIDEDGEVMDPNSESSPGDLSMPFTITEECMPYAATTVDPVGTATGDSPESANPAITTYAAWTAAGKPRCWCFQAQCRGNADGITEGNTKSGFYHVGPGDIDTILAAWDTPNTFWVKEPTFGTGIAGLTSIAGVPAECGNFNRMQAGNTKSGFYKVGPNDMARILTAWDASTTFWVKEPPFNNVSHPDYPNGVPLNDCGGSLIGP